MKQHIGALVIALCIIHTQCFEKTITLRNISIPASILMGAWLVRDGIMNNRNQQDEQARKATRFFVTLEECEQQTKEQQPIVFGECMRRGYTGDQEFHEYVVAAKKSLLEAGFVPGQTRMMLKKIEEIEQRIGK